MIIERGSTNFYAIVYDVPKACQMKGIFYFEKNAERRYYALFVCDGNEKQSCHLFGGMEGKIMEEIEMQCPLGKEKIVGNNNMCTEAHSKLCGEKHPYSIYGKVLMIEEYRRTKSKEK